jgi:ParB-like chromosome segregation protein Spo0J
MPSSIRTAFQPNVIMLQVANIVPSREVQPQEREEKKYRQIQASILSVGVVEPLVVFPAGTGEGKGKYRLLDGQKRLDILARKKVVEVECIIATEDETYTYNKRVNYLSPIGEHQMILRALKHNSADAIAKALALNVRTIRRKRDLLIGICKDAIELLKDRRIAPNAFSTIRKMKPVRQVEVAQLMMDSNRYSAAFARALLVGTRADMLLEPERVQSGKSCSADQKIGMERETDALLRDLKRVETSYGTDVLALSVSCRYVGRMLANEKVRSYIEGRFPDILRELEAVVASAESQFSDAAAIGT